MRYRTRRRGWLLGLTLAIALAATACGGDDDAGGGTGGASLSGSIVIDGSSTVAPISEAITEEFNKQESGVKVTVGTSGTGGGFTKFCNGETDISDASRAISDEEQQACAAKGIRYQEFRIGLDGLAVVTSSRNSFLDTLNFKQLAEIFKDGGATTWNQVDPSFPDEPLTLAGPGTDSGTFDYFTDAINGEEGASRTDYNASEDDNVIVQAVSGEKGGLGYLGFTYYEENTDTLKALEVDGGSGCVAPSAETAQDGTYTPLSRPLFIYVKTESIQTKPQVAGFVDYYLNNLDAIAEAAQFITAPDEVVSENLTKLETQEG
jgi:phosphate transport system substrate-binding protein